MKKLKKKLSSIVEEIKDVKVHYIDYPMHHNIGDLLIYLGTENFFKENDINVVGRYSLYDADIILNTNIVKPNDVLVFHGGGNFGDIYLVCQKLRENLISRFPNNKIVILPQSIYFRYQVNLKKSSEIISAHKNVVIYVRDEESLSIAKLFSDKVYLMPDMAHSLYETSFIHDIKAQTSIVSNELFLARTDKEVADNSMFNNTNSDNIFDWFDLVSDKQELKRKLLSILARTLGKRVYLARFISGLWYEQAIDLSYKGGVKLLSTNDFYTNRLHGMIFSQLLDRTVFMKDNSYGKNSRYYRLWFKNSKLVRWVD
ncbi:polysaccharide pyruvyl transferase family protein [Photobacterium phosphoreum]|uniref:polysaccharide pyruvyl transferase family protein n=1 Tax=Photobacterium phosphoreum TaxID=659 RepID=UPI0039AEE2BA